jgi:uncharacterized membrane protein
MNKTTISTTESFDTAWDKFKQKSVFFIGLAILTAVIGSIQQSNQLFQYDFVNHSYYSDFSIFTVIGMILSSYLGLGIWKIMIKHNRGEEVSLSDLLSISFKSFIHYIIASLVATIATLVGLILLIVPGIHIALRLMFIPAFIVDKNQTFDEAMKSSWAITKGFTFKLFLWCLLATLVILMGIIALIVGLFVALPVISLSLAYIYLKLCEDESIQIS